MYTLKDIENISKQKYEYKLDNSVLKLLKEIDIIINDSKYKLRPDFKYKSKIIVNRDNINKLIDLLRLNMNKLSDKNYTVQLEKITSILRDLEKEYEDSDIEKCALIIYEIASTNLFYSNLYARLYQELYKKFKWIHKPLNITLKTFIKSYNEITSIHSIKNYDLFCKIIKDNNRRLAILNFLVQLIKCGIVEINFVYDIVHYIIAATKNKNTSKDEIQQLSEHLYIIVKDLKDVLQDDLLFDTIVKHIDTYKSMKPIDNISYKTIFKYMDINDLIKNN
tara:strand:+ start:2257 stop:3093 length:837 start_codon:yes stop_codon:yes gene_type:complete